MIKILAFSGSLRKASYNQSVVAAAAQGAVQAGAEVTIVQLKDYLSPLFNEDLEAEQGMPATAQAFKDLLIGHDGFLIASPEYNSSYSAALKNAIDWASRGADGEKPLAAFRGKTALLMGASPGALGGLRGLVSLRMLLGNLGMHVHPAQQAFSKVHTLIDEQGLVSDDKTLSKCHDLGAQLVQFTTAIKG
jgi:NAD(P)H-dependent FMN reductase